MLTFDVANEIVRYDPSTGNLHWRVDRPPYGVAGQIAQVAASNGYSRVKLAGKYRYAHRVAWLLTYGAFPEKAIDHINGVRSDNRIDNLREATPHQNAANVNKHMDGASPYKGVSWSRSKSRWRATICHFGRWEHIGYFGTAEEARVAYLMKALELFGVFAKNAA